MATEELTERVIAVIAKAQKLSREKISLDSSFEELNIDSLDGLNILFALEEEFDVTVPDDPRGIRSIREILAIIERMMAEQPLRTNSEASSDNG